MKKKYQLTFLKRKPNKNKADLSKLSFSLTSKGEKIAEENEGNSMENRLILIIKENQPVTISRTANLINESNKFTAKMLFRLKKKNIVAIRSEQYGQN